MIENFNQWQNAFMDAGMVASVQAVDDHVSKLSLSELDLIESSVAKRQHTFSTGRYCAKSALSEIGINTPDYDNKLLRQSDGSVAWPMGSIGSISHTNEWAIAAVSKDDSDLVSIGIDIERIDRVEKDILKLIATDAERQALEANFEIRWGRVALFSIKESVYKCLRPIYGEFIQFKDVQLSNLSSPCTHPKDIVLKNDVEIYCPSVQLLLPALAQCCDEGQIKIRLAVMPKHVISLVTYHRT